MQTAGKDKVGLIRENTYNKGVQYVNYFKIILE